MTSSPDESTCKTSIALIGMRGAGKTSVGRELARILGGEHVDTDKLLEEQAGQSIAEIFRTEGEVGFRRRERAVIGQVIEAETAVISVGGGAILDEQNLSLLRTRATLVWLTAPVEVLHERVSRDPATASQRPPLTDRPSLEELQHLLAERTPHYHRAADLTIDTTDGEPAKIAARIAVCAIKRH
jgi:shikimate kinase